ncbi:hypothetical protein PhCBS80983_g03385 [Powellomyces hirtus]|uniref:Mei2-like C-terminal RNA recognition motif domain-containing protein n=1 Tax=Powellomyces hirtus TaxID=109895 RepID=A0A507E3T5_9FUNG|nr:hypothetical protein PhCBS80983_g03385 [Powellomyces hirtus]
MLGNVNLSLLKPGFAEARTTAGKENDVGMPWNPESFASEYDTAYADTYPKTTYSESPAIWRKMKSPYLQEPAPPKIGHSRENSFTGDYKDLHQTPPRHLNPPTPAHSPYGGVMGSYDPSVSDGAHAKPYPGSPDRGELLALVNRLHTPPLSPHTRERVMRSQNAHYEGNAGPLIGEEHVMPGFDGPGEIYKDPSNGSLGIPYEGHRAPEQGRFNHSRNIALDNLPVHISLGELRTLLQSFGDVRYMFRPKQGLYSGVIVMFFDIEHAMGAYRALCSMNLGNRRGVTYFVDPEQLHALLGGDLSAGDPFVAELIDNQGEVLLSGFAHRDDAAVLRILETYGKVSFLRSVTYGNHVSYAAEFLDTRAARQAFESLHGFVLQDYPIHVAFPRSISAGVINTHPHTSSSARFPRGHAANNPSRARMRALSSSPVGHGPELANYSIGNDEDAASNIPGLLGRSWQSLKHKGLKIDTSSPAVPPSPLRRAASANCVNASLARELESSIFLDPKSGAPRTANPLGRSHSTKHTASPARQAGSGSPNKYGKGTNSPRYDSGASPQPVPPPNEHSIPAANELNLYNIAMGYDTRTTFMIRNIPNKYTQQMLIAFLNRTHKGEFDFLYLRMDFKNRCNVGYAFINFTGSAAILSFAERVVGKKWSKFNSDKVCTLSYANIQGKNALIQKFRNSSVMLEAQDWRPKIFYTEGPNIGEEEPFPFPTMAIRPRSDVLFSRDNAGQPHRIAGSDSPSGMQGGRSSPRRKTSRDQPDFQSQQWLLPGREDLGANRDTPTSSLTDRSLDEIDFSKLILEDSSSKGAVHVTKGNGTDRFQTWCENSGPSPIDSANGKLKDRDQEAEVPERHSATWSMP